MSEPNKVTNLPDKTEYKFITQKKRVIVCIPNTKTLLEKLNMEIKLNEASYEIEIYHKGIRKPTTDNEFTITQIHSDAAITRYELAKGTLIDHIFAIGSENKYNPVTDYLTSSYEKHKEELSAFSSGAYLENLFDCLTIDTSIMPRSMGLLLFKKWFANATKMAFNTLEIKDQSDGVLTFAGGEGAGKTHFIKNLAPKHISKDYIKVDAELNLADKDTRIQAFQYWIVELGEVDHVLKHAGANIKSFLTSSDDIYRAPYGRFNIKRARNTVFAGTTNELESLLNNFTGNRRYWILPIISIDHDKFNKLMTNDFLEQLWADAMYLWKSSPEFTRLSKTELVELKQVNDTNFKAKSEVEHKVDTFFDWDAPRYLWVFNLKAGEIMNALGLKSNKKIGDALREHIPDLTQDRRKTFMKLPPFNENVKWDTRVMHQQTHETFERLKKEATYEDRMERQQEQMEEEKIRRYTIDNNRL